MCERTLRNYRRTVRENSLAQLLFQHLTDVLIPALNVDTRRQRIDSTTVRSAVRTLSPLGIVVETVSQFLRELARFDPALYARVEPEIMRLYVERQARAVLP
jgi:hypothetical protein